MTDNKTFASGDREYKKFSGNIGSSDINVNDISQATKVETVSSETLTLGAGAAGTTGKIRTTYAPISDSIGGNTGYYKSVTDNDTSLSLTHAALAGDEVQFNRYTDVDSIYATLANGEYTVDYIKGIIYYKKGTADTAGTIDYKYTSQEVDLSVSSVSIGDVTSNLQNIATQTTAAAILTKQTDKNQMTQITDGTSEADVIATINSLKTDLSSVNGVAVNVGAGDVGTATQRVTVANDDTNLKNITAVTNPITAGATTATKTFAVGGQYLVTPPTITDTHSAALQLDVNGNLKTNVVAGTITADLDGQYDVTTNPDPDSVGVLVHENIVAGDLDKTKQTVRTTGGVSVASIASNTFFGSDTRASLYAADATGDNATRLKSTVAGSLDTNITNASLAVTTDVETGLAKDTTFTGLLNEVNLNDVTTETNGDSVATKLYKNKTIYVNVSVNTGAVTVTIEHSHDETEWYAYDSKTYTATTGLDSWSTEDHFEYMRVTTTSQTDATVKAVITGRGV